jgi:23S rRNA-/tRNA-specific pseudouridylate synthase
MERLFRQHHVSKEYVTIVDGVPNDKKGMIDFPMVPIHRQEGQTRWGVDKLKKSGAKAITNWEVMHRGKDCAMIICRPITGRTHQLRVHLSAIGHPILGDPLYGKRYRCAFVPKRLMLHAWKLSFPHPMNEGKRVDVEAPLPEDIVNAKDWIS